MKQEYELRGNMRKKIFTLCVVNVDDRMIFAGKYEKLRSLQTAIGKEVRKGCEKLSITVNEEEKERKYKTFNARAN